MPHTKSDTRRPQLRKKDMKIRTRNVLNEYRAALKTIETLEKADILITPIPELQWKQNGIQKIYKSAIIA